MKCGCCHGLFGVTIQGGNRELYLYYNDGEVHVPVPSRHWLCLYCGNVEIKAIDHKKVLAELQAKGVVTITSENKMAVEFPPKV